MDIFGVSIQPTATVGDIIQACSLLVSTLTLLYAIWAGRRAVNIYRKQRHLDTRAEVAGNALVEVYKLTDFLFDMTRDAPNETTSERDRRWEPARELEQSFRVAQLHADAHLGEIEKRGDATSLADQLSPKMA